MQHVIAYYRLHGSNLREHFLAQTFLSMVGIAYSILPHTLNVQLIMV